MWNLKPPGGYGWGHDARIGIWDAATGKSLIKRYNWELWSINWSPKGAYLLSPGEEGILIWEPSGRSWRSTKVGWEDPVHTGPEFWSSDGSRVLINNRVYSLESHQYLTPWGVSGWKAIPAREKTRTPSIGRGQIGLQPGAPIHSPDRTRKACVNSDGTISIWQATRAFPNFRQQVRIMQVRK
jgi:hypothetical protein